MTKISQLDAFRTTTVFLMDETIENNFEKIISQRVYSMKTMLQQINHKEGLIECISKHPDALESIVTLMGVSTEKFKRVVSWIRMSMGYVFDSEMNYHAIREYFCSNEKFRNTLCNLLLDGRNNGSLKEIVPKFILDNFFINADVLSKLSSSEVLRNLIKDKLSTDYNNQYCELYRRRVKQKFVDIANGLGLPYETDVLVKDVLREVDSNDKFSVHIIEKAHKKIVLAPHFYMTTSSSQGKFATCIIDPLYKSLRECNGVLINMLDGAGWIGRSSDFGRIYSACHYFSNLKNINNLKLIIEEV